MDFYFEPLARVINLPNCKPEKITVVREILNLVDFHTHAVTVSD